MPRHPNIKPLDILWQDGIESRAFTGIIAGLWEILRLAGIAGQLPIVSRGMVALPSFLYHKDKEVLHPKIDIEPFLAIARQQSRRPGFLHAPVILDALRNEPTYKNQSRYALLIVKEKIHWDDPGIYHEIAGCAYPGDNAVISLGSYWPWFNPENFAVFELLTRLIAIHELGHVFGLERIENGHCKNDCAMSSKVDFEFKQSIQNNPLCPSCLEKLRAYFTATP